MDDQMHLGTKQISGCGFVVKGNVCSWVGAPSIHDRQNTDLGSML